MPSTGEVKPPEWLRPEAVEVWERLAPDLVRKGLLTPWDVDTFAILCDAIVQYKEASAFVAKSSVLIRGRKDALVKNPAMQLERDLAQLVRAYSHEFGLTPSARAAIKTPEQPGDDEADRLLS